ncbi:MAG: glycosyltransferase [Pseudobdellovibrio sp.]
MNRNSVFILGPANSIHLEKWTNPLADSYDVHILTFHAPTEFNHYASNIKIHTPFGFTGTKLDYLLSIPRTLALLREYKPVLIHAHYLSSYGLLAAFVPSKSPKLLSVWGSDLLKRSRSPLFRLIFKLALPSFQWINSASSEITEKLYEFGVPSEKVKTFQYGLDLSCFKLQKTAYNRGAENFTLISCRLWSELYNIDRIIAGFKKSYKLNSRLKLLLVGYGTKAPVDQITQSVNGHPGIEILGRLTHDQLTTRLNSAHAMISIPNSDGTPLTLLESIAAGNYPILSNLKSTGAWVAKSPLQHTVTDLSAESISALIDSAEKNYDFFNADLLIEKVKKEADYFKNIETLKTAYRDLAILTPADPSP